MHIYKQAAAEGVFLAEGVRRGKYAGDESVQDLHNMSAGAALAKLVLWLLGLKVRPIG